ncbi:hypothetical protein HK405_007504 [Cladochytrium tenue]|nr:hypothetical protein HK405_007504 [Cladochytrium tenue]
MSDRHFFDAAAVANTDARGGLVLRALRGVATLNPAVRVVPSLRILVNPSHPRNRVAVIAGGGSGHEPGFAGFVGDGLLAAAVPGDVFASPSARQVRGAIAAVPSSAGTVLVVTNYTGDNLHFGLACQQARAAGIPNVGIVLVTDDVAVTRSKGELVGRRALAGCIVVSKIVGAAAAEGMSFDHVVAVGEAVNEHLASIATTLDHAHVPGRSEHGKLPEGTCEMGLGLHNEPGVFTLSPTPSAEVLVAKMLHHILDQDDPERGFFAWAPDDDMALLINNMGGLSVLETSAFVEETIRGLASHGIKPPRRVYAGAFMTTLNAPGASITLLNLTRAAASASARDSTLPLTADDLLRLLDAPHRSLAWPAPLAWPTQPQTTDPAVDALADGVKALAAVADDHGDDDVVADDSVTFYVDPKILRSVIRTACESLRDAEPNLTKWDMIVGDGDCGFTCQAGAEAVLAALASPTTPLGADGNLVATLRRLTHLVEDACGGTLGAIFAIYLAALTSELRAAAASKTKATLPAAAAAASALAAAAATAIPLLHARSRARPGHRTVVDALQPFAESLAASAAAAPDGRPDVALAARAARDGAAATAAMQPRLGRAVYVGDDHGQLPPDPGAMAVAAIVDGIEAALATAAANA